MGVVASFSYDFIYGLVNSNAISTLMSICIGGGVYGVCILVLKAFSNDELIRFPVIGGIFKKFIKEK